MTNDEIKTEAARLLASDRRIAARITAESAHLDGCECIDCIEAMPDGPERERLMAGALEDHLDTYEDEVRAHGGGRAW